MHTIPALGLALGFALAPAAALACDCGDKPRKVAQPNTTLVGTQQADCLVGTAGDDVIIGKGGADVICGLGGHDVLRGGPGNDVIHGGPGDDSVEGNGGDDTLFGDAGNDVIRAGQGNDSMHGGEGMDLIVTNGTGGDTVDPGPGADRVQLRAGSHALRCAPGPLLVFGRGAKAGLTAAPCPQARVVSDGGVAVQHLLRALAPGAPAPTPTPPAQTEFTVHLTSPGPAKIKVIKVVRAVTNLGLKEAKALVDDAPIAIKEGLDRATADVIARQLREAGGEVEVR